jgi:hypothetical protein
VNNSELRDPNFTTDNLYRLPAMIMASLWVTILIVATVALVVLVYMGLSLFGTVGQGIGIGLGALALLFVAFMSRAWTMMYYEKLIGCYQKNI